METSPELDALTLTPAQHEAIRLLHRHTDGRFDFWSLSGRSLAARRAEVMSALLGRKVTQGDSGVTAMRAAFYAIAKPAGDCEASRHPAFVEWAKRAMIGD